MEENKEDETNDTEILDEDISPDVEIEQIPTEPKKDVVEPQETKSPTIIKIRCSQCNSAQIYTTSTHKVCRKCGYREVLNGR